MAMNATVLENLILAKMEAYMPIVGIFKPLIEGFRRLLAKCVAEAVVEHITSTAVVTTPGGNGTVS